MTRDERIANADGRADLQVLWRDLKRQEQENVRRLKQRIGEVAIVDKPGPDDAIVKTAHAFGCP